LRRVLIDTDVGLDVDDAYALAFAARSPELAVEGVTTVYGDTLLRAKIACKVLRLAGRGDIPVVAGLGKPLSRDREAFMFGFEGEGILDEEDEGVSVSTDAADFLVSMSTSGVTLVTIGPLTNVAAAIRCDPEVAEKVEEIIVMGGLLEPVLVEGKVIPVRTEYNVNCDPEATITVLESGARVTLVPLNTTMKVENALGEAELAALKMANTPLTRMLLRASELWLKRLGELSHASGMPPERVRLWMHDPLTVALTINRHIFTIEKLRVKVYVERGELRMAIREDGCEINVCRGADYKAFKKMLIERLVKI